MNAEKAVAAYARRRMARGELLTWQFDADHHRATLYVPEGVPVSSFPKEIAGIAMRIRHLPRPVHSGLAG
ncbi:hypothetical protein H7K45_24950 [Mycobacterium yunnanensis]|uniref:Uncharacterized protein n=1 Tax=Mycobacterium yunnanensis TaxID=368477 RepID=A0A9X2YQV5_9MYCO|nr:hypothetical protein [Mycobacterium yunnanensis]MCV7423808.1 hypothetical protein [Mycobacterium yunnanensis]